MPRKSNTPAEVGSTERIALRLSAPAKTRLVAEAKAEGKSISALILDRALGAAGGDGIGARVSAAIEGLPIDDDMDAEIVRALVVQKIVAAVTTEARKKAHLLLPESGGLVANYDSARRDVLKLLSEADPDDYAKFRKMLPTSIDLILGLATSADFEAAMSFTRAHGDDEVRKQSARFVFCGPEIIEQSAKLRG